MKTCSHKTHSGANPLPESEFYKRSRSPDGLQPFCKGCSNPDAHPRNTIPNDERCVRFLLNRIKQRAKNANILYNVSYEDFLPLPTHCPDLGVELVYGNPQRHSNQSASVDKIIPELGYVPGNVRIVSHQANAMKQGASLEQLRTMALSWLRLVEQTK